MTRQLLAMGLQHLPEVLRIERLSFATPWTEEQFREELRGHAHAANRVAVEAGAVAGYLCVWCVVDELRIHTVAVDPLSRRGGWGRFLLGEGLAEAKQAGLRIATLEVRESNRAAQALYRNFGFVEVGRRPGYYPAVADSPMGSVPAEAAILMDLELA